MPQVLFPKASATGSTPRSSLPPLPFALQIIGYSCSLVIFASELVEMYRQKGEQSLRHMHETENARTTTLQLLRASSRLRCWLVMLLPKVRIPIRPHPQRLRIFHLILGGESESLLRKPGSLSKGVKVLETAVGAVFAPTRFSLVRISIRGLVADRNP